MDRPTEVDGQPEQDSAGGGDDLPTYDDLAAQSGPNSRFGRWRGWIEKRAAERYADVTPDERQRRRERGWGRDSARVVLPPEQSSGPAVTLNEPLTPTPFNLHIQTDLPPMAPPDYILGPPSPETPPPLVGQSLSPAHLTINQFGSRFLPHTTSQMHCLLPLAHDRLLLIGHSNGPQEAQARPIWEGEGVFQMSILELESNGERSPNGVVLALVGPEHTAGPPAKDESLRTLRMYNLGSLTSLAKWAVSQKDLKPLDMRRPSQWNAQTPTKKHRSHNSIAKGFKSLIESPHSPHQSEPHSSSYHSLLSTVGSLTASISTLSTQGSGNASPDSTWDFVDDLPLRWATDFVPLAGPGSRLTNTTVISYALYRDENRRGRGGALLAVGTRSNILLYETPPGERAFRFVKEFYTPLMPRSLTFVEQAVQGMTRRPSDGATMRHNRMLSAESSHSSRSERRTSSITSPSTTLDYGSQRSIFVLFEKKAGIIRIADSAVSEVELYDDGAFQHQRHESMSTPTSRRSRASFEGHGSAKEKGMWIPPSKADLPVTSGTIFSREPASKTVYFITRGRQTHITTSPLPANIAATPPLMKLTWQSHPSSVSPRVCYPPPAGSPPFLQLVAVGEDGVEVQEVSLSFLGKGKGKGRAEEPVRAQMDIGGDTGFLCEGGHWNRLYQDLGADLVRSYSCSSGFSDTSFDSLETEELAAKLRVEQGIYGWCQKGMEDWRVFWIGGHGSTDTDSND
ncbi:hypothetical protein PLICRDRAFT_187014 [Plicaturopsis crispa FD-325 SS-3]|nr:hypothetical protein PLICRDRAFT_187014 [Plicaturopsis crispa FD-325 SS-3]